MLSFWLKITASGGSAQCHSVNEGRNKGRRTLAQLGVGHKIQTRDESKFSTKLKLGQSDWLYDQLLCSAAFFIGELT
jgi:hypothetical protein